LNFLNINAVSVFLLFATFSSVLIPQNSLSPLELGKIAQTVEELWAEPLKVENIREWDEVYEDKQIKAQMLTFMVGTFKNLVNRTSTYYAYPKGVTEKYLGLYKRIKL
jgi:hypothetical protein